MTFSHLSHSPSESLRSNRTRTNLTMLCGQLNTEDVEPSGTERHGQTPSPHPVTLPLTVATSRGENNASKDRLRNLCSGCCQQKQVCALNSDVWSLNVTSEVSSWLVNRLILNLVLVIAHCGIAGSILAFWSIGHGFESEHRLCAHQSASAISKLRSLAQCSLDDSVRCLL